MNKYGVPQSIADFYDRMALRNDTLGEKIKQYLEKEKSDESNNISKGRKQWKRMVR